MVKSGVNSRVINQLISNNVSMQKVATSLLTEIRDLTKRIDKLVGIFEEASKHVGEVDVTDDHLKQLTAKLEVLLEQNKDLAKGLLMLEKYVKTKSLTSLSPKPLQDFNSF